MGDDQKIPKGRVRRSAKLGSALGVQATRYAGTKAAGLARSDEGAKERLEARHLETALKIASTLGEMKGAAMKVGQLASFIDTEFLPPEYAEIYQEELAKLRTSAPAMPWEKVEKVLREEYRDEALGELFTDIEPEAFAAASIGQVHRATLHDGRVVAVKVQYPGVAEAMEADLANMRDDRAPGEGARPRLDPRGIAAELSERVLEELDYEYEAQNQRAFARAYRGHPFIHVPDVVTRLSSERVLVTEYVDGAGFDEILAADRRGAGPLRGDRLPVLLRLRLPPPALQRRRPSRQLHAHGRRPRGLHRLRHDEAARPQPDRPGGGGRSRPSLRRSRAATGGAARSRLPQAIPARWTPRSLMDHVRWSIGGWYMEDRDYEVSTRAG